MFWYLRRTRDVAGPRQRLAVCGKASEVGFFARHSSAGDVSRKIEGYQHSGVGNGVAAPNKNKTYCIIILYYNIFETLTR